MRGEYYGVGDSLFLFACLRREEGPLTADEIADVEELPESELVAETLHLGINLELAGFVLNMGEDILAHFALGDQASGDADRAVLRVIFHNLAAVLRAGI